MTESQTIERKIFLYNQYVQIVSGEYAEKIAVLKKRLRAFS